ncbi:MAG: cystathionine beta-lyase [Desulfobulbaceae bacterium]|nr:cystathionine beta-lyase [Desulfobulbaceae bacterium]
MNEQTTLIFNDEFYNEIHGKKVKTVNPPVYSGSTVLFESYEDLTAAINGRYKGIAYGTDRLPTQRAFEEALCSLERGFVTRAFPSGINAIINTLLTYTETGDHILLCENVYGPTARFCKKVLRKYGVAVDFLPGAVGEEVANHLRENTRLIYLESPGSNTFEIHDIPAVTAIARQRGIITMLDNTWATPLYLKALELGIDISIQSVSKYISGHSDLLLGAVTVNERYAQEFIDFYRVMENFASPHDCALALRGLKTLHLRLRQHEHSALSIARQLQIHPLVDQVIHPALAEHPQHHLWQRDFQGSTGLFGFTFKRDYTPEELALFINSLQLFGIGFSWGGYKSLITAGKYRRDSALGGKTIIRLNIGLEEPEDLLADLEHGFTALTNKAGNRARTT